MKNGTPFESARIAFTPSVSRGVGRGALWMRFCRAPGYCKRDLSKKFCMKSIFFASAVRADTEGAVLGGARPFARHAGRLLCLRSAPCGQAVVPSPCAMRAGFCAFALRHAGRLLRLRPAPCRQVFAFSPIFHTEAKAAAAAALTSPSPVWYNFVNP